VDWYWALAFIFGGLMILLATGLPVAFGFLLINIVGIYFFWGGIAGLHQLILSIYAALANFILIPIPMFFLMGEIMFQSGLAASIIDAVDKWLGSIRGRLSYVAVAAATLFSVLTGVPMATVALLGTILIPEMEKRGYRKEMTMGPILGSGGLAMLIPPSALAVLLASLAEISVSKMLIGGIVPGLILAILYALYIFIRCRIQQSIAPVYDVPPIPLKEKMGTFFKHILPLVLVIFMVIGLMFLGVATPSESAAMGVLGCFILVACHKKLKWDVFKKSLTATAKLTVMVTIVIAGSTAFSQMLAFSQGSKGLVEAAMGLKVEPILLIIGMQLVLFILGCFMDIVAMMMITIPIFFPLVISLDFDPLWFGILMLLNMEVAPVTPPFGLELFVMKAVAPKDTTMADVYKAAVPFIVIDSSLLFLMLFFPKISLWLPNLM